jgi:energy-coupling factor transport system permease protein
LNMKNAFSYNTSYVGEDSVIHRLDPRIKLGLVLGTTLLSVFLQNMAWLVTLVMMLLALSAISGTLKRMTKFLGLFFLFAVLTVAIMTLLTRNFIYSLEYFSPFFLRFGVMATAGMLFAFTTSPNHLSLALQKMRFPASLSFTLTVTLRYIPTLANEAEAIFNALRLRGVYLSNWDVIRKPSYLYRGMIIPLFIRILKLSDEIAIAAESRAFNGGNGRSSLKIMEIDRNDLFFSLTMIMFCSVLMVMDKVSFSLI